MRASCDGTAILISTAEKAEQFFTKNELSMVAEQFIHGNVVYCCEKCRFTFASGAVQAAPSLPCRRPIEELVEIEKARGTIDGTPALFWMEEDGFHVEFDTGTTVIYKGAYPTKLSLPHVPGEVVIESGTIEFKNIYK